MALTTSLYTSLTGLSTNSQMIDVAGNNIANVNTTAFKRSRISFETAISQTLSNGSGPTAELGGTNPSQIGLGAQLGSVRRVHTSGSLQPTGASTDMAIEGDGFFIVDDAGSERYTRNGNFALDSEFKLVTAGGARVQGFGVDDDYQIVDGVLEDIQIPLSTNTIAEATENVKFAGNLNASGDLATQGSITQTQALFSDAAGTIPALGTTALAGLFNADGTQPFAAGDIITVTGATREVPLGAVILALFFAAAMMILAAFARTFRDGQSMVTPIYWLAIIPIFLGQAPDQHLTAELALVPIVNVTLMIRDAIQGIFSWPLILESLAVGLLMVAACIWIARWILEFEDVLMGSYDGSFWRFLRERVRS